MPTEAQQRLREVLDSVFADMKVEASERQALEQAISDGKLSEGEQLATFEAFVEAKWGEAMEDGRLSPQERMFLAKIVRVLGVSPESLPPMMRVALEI